MNRIEQIQTLNALLEGDIKSAARREELERQLAKLQSYEAEIAWPSKVQLGNDILKTVVEDDDALFWAKYAIDVLHQPYNTVTILSE